MSTVTYLDGQPTVVVLGNPTSPLATTTQTEKVQPSAPMVGVDLAVACQRISDYSVLAQECGVPVALVNDIKKGLTSTYLGDSLGVHLVGQRLSASGDALTRFLLLAPAAKPKVAKVSKIAQLWRWICRI
jgi:hypothetical protein